MKPWRRGLTLCTPLTRDWTQQKIYYNNLKEQQIVFSDFMDEDQGRSRQKVCTLNIDHQKYERNARMIENAPEMLRALKDSYVQFHKINPDWATKIQTIIKSIDPEI